MFPLFTKSYFSGLFKDFLSAQAQISYDRSDHYNHPKVINTERSLSRDVTPEAADWPRRCFDVTSLSFDWSRKYVDYLGCFNLNNRIRISVPVLRPSEWSAFRQIVDFFAMSATFAVTGMLP